MTNRLYYGDNRFKHAAGELESDDDPECFRVRLRKIAKHNPAEKAE